MIKNLFHERFIAGAFIFAVIGLVHSISAEINAFSELSELVWNKDFVYEQTQVPPALRKFFIPLSLVHENTHAWVDWCKRIEKLLHGLSIPSSIQYVARKYAPHTHAEIASMCAKMKLEPTLIFLARKSNKHIKTVEAFSLGGQFNALVFSSSFVERHSVCEIRAVVARELTKIARRHSEKENIARKMWWGVASGVAAVGAIGCLRTAMKDGNWQKQARKFIKQHSSSALISFLVVAGCSFVAEIVDAHLSRKYQHEADLFALKAFGRSPEEYLEALKNVETEESLRRQRVEYQYKDHYYYVATKIKELAETVYPSVTCFLNNELYAHHKRQIEMPAILQKAGIFDTQSSLEERIAYVHEHAPHLEGGIMQPKRHTSSEDDSIE